MNTNYLPIFALFSLLVVLLLVRVLVGKSAWPFHAGGQVGYLNDELVRLSAVIIPPLIVGGFISFFRALSMKTIVIIALAMVLVVRYGAQKLPFIKGASERIRLAREAYFQSKSEGQKS